VLPGRWLVPVACAAALAVGCTIPADPDGTLERVEGGTMRVGVTATDPWVRLRAGRPSGGVEVALVRRFARDLDARVEWVPGSEEELVKALKEGSLDLVVGGITSESRWKHDAAFTRPYVEHEGQKHVMAAPMGENAWLVRLERFLLDREAEVEELLRAEEGA
jgi:polar amino acid transport system substrate-binding protein